MNIALTHSDQLPFVESTVSTVTYAVSLDLIPAQSTKSTPQNAPNGNNAPNGAWLQHNFFGDSRDHRFTTSDKYSGEGTLEQRLPRVQFFAVTF